MRIVMYTENTFAADMAFVGRDIRLACNYLKPRSSRPSMYNGYLLESTQGWWQI